MSTAVFLLKSSMTLKLKVNSIATTSCLLTSGIITLKLLPVKTILHQNAEKITAQTLIDHICRISNKAAP